MLAQIGIVAVSAALAVLAFTGWITTAAVFVCAALVGLLSVVEMPGRQVFVGELVGPKGLANAISMNQSTFQIGSILGAALGAAMIPLGTGWAFLGTALLTGVWLVGLLFIRPHALYPRARAERTKGQIVEALRYARRKPPIFWTLLMLVFLCLLGTNWSVLLIAFADRIFESGGSGYGISNAVLAAGSIVGAIIALRRVTISLRAVYSFAAAMLVFRLAAAWMPDPITFSISIFLSSLCMMLMWTTTNPLLQSSSNGAIRGRVMSLYLLITVGGPALGAPALGWLVEHIGTRWAMCLSAGVTLLAVAGLALLQLRRRPRPEPR